MTEEKINPELIETYDENYEVKNSGDDRVSEEVLSFNQEIKNNVLKVLVKLYDSLLFSLEYGIKYGFPIIIAGTLSSGSPTKLGKVQDGFLTLPNCAISFKNGAYPNYDSYIQNLEKYKKDFQDLTKSITKIQYFLENIEDISEKNNGQKEAFYKELGFFFENSNLILGKIKKENLVEDLIAIIKIIQKYGLEFSEELKEESIIKEKVIQSLENIKEEDYLNFLLGFMVFLYGEVILISFLRKRDKDGLRDAILKNSWEKFAELFAKADKKELENGNLSEQINKNEFTHVGDFFLFLIEKGANFGIMFAIISTLTSPAETDAGKLMDGLNVPAYTMQLKDGIIGTYDFYDNVLPELIEDAQKLNEIEDKTNKKIENIGNKGKKLNILGRLFLRGNATIAESKKTELINDLKTTLEIMQKYSGKIKDKLEKEYYTIETQISQFLENKEKDGNNIYLLALLNAIVYGLVGISARFFRMRGKDTIGTKIRKKTWKKTSNFAKKA